MTNHEASNQGFPPQEHMGEWAGPPRVDFDAIAVNAVANGVFAVSERDPQNPTMPTSLLEVPYVTGPEWIISGRPLSQKAIDAVRHNFAKANRLLVPDRQVSMYIYHERLPAGDIFETDGVWDAVAEYRPGLAVQISFCA